MKVNSSGLFNVDPSAAEGLSLACDGLSIGRCVHSVQLIIAGESAGLAFNIFGAVGSLFIIANASRLLDKAIVQLKDAKTTEMKIFHTVIHVPGELNYLIIGLSMLALKVSHAAGVALSWTPVFFNALMGSFLAMSAIKFIEACYGLSITYTLRDILEDQDETDSEGLANLKIISEEGGAEIGTFTASALPKEELIKIKIDKLKLLADADLEKLSMQTDKKCAQSIKDFNLETSTFEDCQKLLKEVKKANYDANTDFWLLLGVATVSVAAAGVGLTLTGPLADIAENVLCAIASIAWINMDATELRDATKKWCWDHHVKSESGEYPALEQAAFWTKTAASIITAPIWVIPSMAYHKVSSELGRILPAI